MSRPAIQTYDSSNTVITVASGLTLPVEQVSSPEAAVLKDSFPTPLKETADFLNGPTRCSTPVDNDKSSPTLEKLRLRLFACCFGLFVSGWGDGVTGALLPYFKAEYHLSDMTSSLYFVAVVVGFTLGTFSIESILSFLGRPCPKFLRRSKQSSLDRYSRSWSRFRTLIIAATAHGIYFLIMALRLGFISSLVAYVLSAYARAFLSTLIYAYIAITPTKPMALALGSWSLGAVIAPLISQSVIAQGTPWVNFYFGSITVAAMNVCVLALAFRPMPGELAAEASEVVSEKVIEPSIEHGSTETLVDTPKPTLRKALTTPYQWAFSAFILFYSGCETSFQGFVATFLLASRGASPSTVGYVTSGFWGGMTLSRLFWGRLTSHLPYKQRKYLVQAVMYMLVEDLALVMQITVVFVPSMIGNSVATALIGLVWGPIYPECSSMEIEVLDSDIHLISLSILSSTSTLGSAIFPFVAGTISRYTGAGSLAYYFLAQAVALCAFWTIFPSNKPTKKESPV